MYFLCSNETHRRLINGFALVTKVNEFHIMTLNYLGLVDDDNWLYRFVHVIRLYCCFERTFCIKTSRISLVHYPQCTRNEQWDLELNSNFHIYSTVQGEDLQERTDIMLSMYEMCFDNQLDTTEVISATSISYSYQVHYQRAVRPAELHVRS